MKRPDIRISSEDKSGLYLTVIIHVGLVIVLLISQIATAVKGENSYLLDFSAIEADEREQQEAEFKENISDRLDELIAAAPAIAQAMRQAGGDETVRNIAVDAGNGHLSDDRNTDVEQLYRDAARLDRELKSGAFAQEPEDQDSYASLHEDKADMDRSAQQVYSGPSVISYSLDGRKALNLSIPAYRCMGGGDVTVRITVNQAGTVDAVEIMEDASSQDRCLREFAKRAARLSRFTASATAPKRQYGEIVYRFIAQ